MSKNTKMLWISILLMLIGVAALLWSNRNCEIIEYQDLQGTHTMQVCKDLS